MRLIEKKCPNCGAGLSFSENDKSCKCEYCKREFEIERDTDKTKLVDQFNLIPLKTFASIFKIFTIGSFVSSLFITLIIFAVFGLFIFGIIKSIDSQTRKNKESNEIVEEKDLTNNDLELLDMKSKIAIMKNNDNTVDFSLKGSPKREKIYILTKDEENILIPVYKATYQNFFEKEFKYTVYIPVIYENVRSKSNSIIYSLDDGIIDAPEYYFNLEHSDYTYGYQNLEDLNNAILSDFKEYSIAEK